jgi:hypothetical protein
MAPGSSGGLLSASIPVRLAEGRGGDGSERSASSSFPSTYYLLPSTPLLPTPSDQPPINPEEGEWAKMVRDLSRVELL